MGTLKPTFFDASTLQRAWLVWLRLHYWGLRGQHDDLVQECTADLLAWLQQHPQINSEEIVRQVGFRILQRRVADLFRNQVKEWALIEHLDDPTFPAQEIGTRDLDPAELLQKSRLLKVLIKVLTELTNEERELIAGIELGETLPGPRTDSERKRASRLREKIRKILKEEHGIWLE